MVKREGSTQHRLKEEKGRHPTDSKTAVASSLCTLAVTVAMPGSFQKLLVTAAVVPSQLLRALLVPLGLILHSPMPSHTTAGQIN